MNVYIVIFHQETSDYDVGWSVVVSYVGHQAV